MSSRRLKILALLLICFMHEASAQDTLVLNSGKRIPAQIIDTTTFRIKYKKLMGPANKKSGTKVISKTVVSSLIYQDGSRISPNLHKQSAPSDTVSNSLDSSGLYALGKSDASLYYRKYNGASNGTFIASFPGSPALGLIVALSTSLTPPREKNLDMPISLFQTDPDYRAGYMKGARAVKSRNVWSSWLVGSALTILTYYVLSARR